VSAFSTAAGVRSPRRPAARATPPLAMVPRATARSPRVPFVALVMGLLAAGLVGLLVLNTSLQRGVYLETDLRTRAAQLSLREQNLQVQVSRLQSPERLAAVAAASGMVRNDSTAFLSLSSGKVVGVARPARATNAVVAYGGRLAPHSSKMPTFAGGSHNSAGTGVRHQAGVPSSRHSSAHRRASQSGPSPRNDGRPSR
jgi:hypothetical protein